MADVRMNRLAQVLSMAADHSHLPTWEHLASKTNQEEMDVAHTQIGAQLRACSKAMHHELTYEIHWA